MAKLDHFGASLYDFIAPLVAQADKASMLDRHNLHAFLDSYESLYLFEKEKRLFPRLTKATQKLMDWLLQYEMESVQTKIGLSVDTKLKSLVATHKLKTRTIEEA